MELAKTLIRSVARAFYETRHILVIDALTVHSALPTDDLAMLMNMQAKDCRKLCGRLREDRMITVHSRQELKEGMQRPIPREYYYIDFHATIDVIKYRVWHLTQKVRDLNKPTEEKKDYFCPRCKAKWTQLEVLDNLSYGTNEFLCHRCNGVLERDELSAADRAGHVRQRKLMAELDKILKLLQNIDAETIPQNDFQTALSHAIPIARDESVNPSKKFQPVKPELQAAAKGVKAEIGAQIEVSLISDSATAEAERAARESKAAQEKQNALPVWHTESTLNVKPDPSSPVKSLPFARTGPSSASNAAGIGGPDAFAEGDEDSKNTATESIVNAELAAYYATMEREKERERVAAMSSAEASTDNDDDDDDGEGDQDDEDDGFEDVEIAAGAGASGINTPSSTGPTANGVTANGSRFTGGDVPGVKLESESSSAQGTSAAGTPIDHPEASPAKRVKLETGSQHSRDMRPEQDSDEDEDFEDVV